MRNRLLIVVTVLALVASACAGGFVEGEVTEDGTATTITTATNQAADPDPGETSTTSVGGAGSKDQSEPSDQSEPADGSTTVPRSSKEPERVPDDTTPPITGETPGDLLAQIIADAADRAGVTDSDVTVIRDEFAIWNDGSLGCPEPGVMYTQATVDGYWVVLEANGVDYDYRANTKGYWFLCEGAGLPGQPPSG